MTDQSGPGPVRGLAAGIGDWPDVDGVTLNATFDSYAEPIAGPGNRVAFSEHASYQCDTCGRQDVAVVYYERIGTHDDINPRWHTVADQRNTVPKAPQFDLTDVRCNCGPEVFRKRVRAFDAALPGPTNAAELV